MTTAQRIFKNFLSLSFAQVISRGLGFVVVIYLARILGADGFGKIGFAQAILAYFMLLVDLGLNTFGTRELARNKEEIQRYVNNILTIRLLASIITFVLAVVFVYFLHKPAEIKKLILLYGLSIFTFTFTIDWIFQGIEKMQFIAISQVTRQLVYVGLIFCIVRSPQQLLKVPLLNVFASVVAVFVLLSIFKRNFRLPKLEFDLGFWKNILRQSLPMGVSSILIQIYYNFDIIMLGFIKDEEVVGWYIAAYKIVLLLIGFGGIIGNVLLPVFARYYKESLKKMRELISFSAKVMITIAVPIGICGVIFAKPIMNLTYGELYYPGIICLQLLIWSVVTVYCNVPFAFSLLACDQQNNYMYSVATGTIINVTLNLWLIPPYSLVGAAVATIISEVVVLIMLYFYAQKIVSVPIGRFILKVVLASIIMGISAGLMPGSLFLRLSGAIVIYFLVAIIVGVIKKEDVLLAKNFLAFKQTNR